jgi:hypothetical protein
MTTEQFGQKLLVNRNLSALESRQFPFIVIDQDDLMTEVGKTGSCDQSNVPRTNDGDPHVSDSLD